MVHTCNPSTQEAEAGAQPGLHSETLAQKKKKKSEEISTPSSQHCWWECKMVPLFGKVSASPNN
jgi:hypothetical protein